MTTNYRVKVAAELGYIDARTIVNLKQTNGLPIGISLDYAAKYGLRPDWFGIEIEMQLQLDYSPEKAKRETAYERRDYLLGTSEHWREWRLHVLQENSHIVPVGLGLLLIALAQSNPDTGGQQ